MIMHTKDPGNCAPALLGGFKKAAASDTPPRPITVLLVDDHEVVRAGCRRVLEDTPDIRVVAEADDGEAGCAHYNKYAPDVVLLDLNMRGIDGLETICRIKAQDPKARILVFSLHGDETTIQRALGAGATGYLSKQDSMEKMLEAVRRVAQGKLFIDAEHAIKITGRKLSATSENPLHVLSRRELQLFKLFAEGYSVSEIATVISISRNTVGVHHTNIMKKLGLQNTSQIARLAIRCKVIEA